MAEADPHVIKAAEIKAAARATDVFATASEKREDDRSGALASEDLIEEVSIDGMCGVY